MSTSATFFFPRISVKMSILAHTEMSVREPTLDLIDARIIAYADLKNLCPESLVEKKIHSC